MGRKLFDIEINEITLCKSPANRKKFFIKKMEEKPMSEFIEELKKFMAEDDEDIEKALTKDEIAKAEKLGEKEAKALSEALGIVIQYEDIPDDLEGAILTLVAKASYDYPVVEEEVGKAGAKLSKTTQAQIKMALDHIKDGPKAIDILKTLLGQDVKKKKEDGDGEENLNPETLAKLEKLAELEEAEKERIEKKEKEEADKEKKEKQELLERIEALEKKKGIKKSIDGPDEGDKKKVKKGADDEDEDQWPSVYIPGLPESDD